METSSSLLNPWSRRNQNQSDPGKGKHGLHCETILVCYSINVITYFINGLRYDGSRDRQAILSAIQTQVPV
jgi:hypothetical protein